MHSPQDDPPDLPPHPSSPPDHPQPPFPGATGIPVAPDTIIVPYMIIPPNIDDTPMTQSTKRPPGDPPIPPATKARPSRQMPPASSTQFQPSNHLWGDTQPSVTPNATTQPAVVAHQALRNQRNPSVIPCLMTLMMTSLIQMPHHPDTMDRRYFR